MESTLRNLAGIEGDTAMERVRRTDSLPLRERLREWQPTVIALLGGIVVWEIAGRTLEFTFLPPFSSVVAAMWRMILSGEIPSNLGASLFALFVGYGLAVLIGVPAGILLGRYPTLEYLADPYINALLATPSLLYVPIMFGIFGISRATQIAVIFLYALIIIVVVVMSGVRSVDVSYTEMAQAFGARDRQLFRLILLPGALPTVMAGLRLGMGRAVRGMINGELVIVLVGMGALLRLYGGRFDAASVYGILLVVIIIALICTGVLQYLERRLTRWAN